jgi:hypothetical protein
MIAAFLPGKAEAQVVVLYGDSIATVKLKKMPLTAETLHLEWRGLCYELEYIGGGLFLRERRQWKELAIHEVEVRAHLQSQWGSQVQYIFSNGVVYVTVFYKGKQIAYIQFNLEERSVQGFYFLDESGHFIIEEQHGY